MKLKKIYFLIGAVISGLLMGFAWTPNYVVFQVFLFLVPIFFILFEDIQLTKFEKVTYVFSK